MGKEKVEVKEKIIVEGVLMDNEKTSSLDMKNNIAYMWSGFGLNTLPILLLPASASFTPASNTWTKLLPPYEVAHFSIHPPPFRGLLADHARNRILLYFHHITSTYAYYPALDQWKLLFDNLIWSPKPVFANAIFYFYKLMKQNMVSAFDEKTKTWLEIDFTSPVPYEVWAKKYDDMFYLGDGLVCFASYRAFYKRERDLSSTTVYLSKFRFQRTNASPPRVLITPLPTETYKLDKGFPIVNYLPF